MTKILEIILSLPTSVKVILIMSILSFFVDRVNCKKEKDMTQDSYQVYASPVSKNISLLGFLLVSFNSSTGGDLYLQFINGKNLKIVSSYENFDSFIHSLKKNEIKVIDRDNVL